MNPNIIKIKKIETTNLCLVVVVILLIMAIFVSPFIYFGIKNSTFQRTDSIEEYLNSNYISYNGGKEAQDFFERFVMSDIGNCVSFKYRDNDAKLSLKSASHTIFVLDVEYGSEDYYSHKDYILNSTNRPDEDNNKNYYGSFLLTSIILEDNLYKNNYCCIGLDNERYVIRYMFFYNTNRSEATKHGIDSIKSTIKSSIMLDWQDESDTGEGSLIDTENGDDSLS